MIYGNQVEQLSNLNVKPVTKRITTCRIKINKLTTCLTIILVQTFLRNYFGQQTRILHLITFSSKPITSEANNLARSSAALHSNCTFAYSIFTASSSLWFSLNSTKKANHIHQTKEILITTDSSSHLITKIDRKKEERDFPCIYDNSSKLIPINKISTTYSSRNLVQTILEISVIGVQMIKYIF